VARGGIYDAAATMSEAVRTMMRMDAEAAQETAAQVDAGFLWDFWYPAARSTEIRGQKLVKAMLLEVPLVLAEPPRGKFLRCGILVRTEGYRFRMGGSTEKWWSAATRMAVRCLQRTMRGDSVALQPGQAEGGADFCGALSLRGTRRIRLGLYECSGDEAAGEDSGGASAYRFQRQIQDHASFVWAAFAH